MDITKENTAELAQNIRYKIEDGVLYLVIDLEETIGPSSSGKMMGIASTGGFTRFSSAGGISPRNKPMSLNLYLGEK